MFNTFHNRPTKDIRFLVGLKQKKLGLNILIGTAAYPVCRMKKKTFVNVDQPLNQVSRNGWQ